MARWLRILVFVVMMGHSIGTQYCQVNQQLPSCPSGTHYHTTYSFDDGLESFCIDCTAGSTFQPDQNTCTRQCTGCRGGCASNEIQTRACDVHGDRTCAGCGGEQYISSNACHNCRGACDASNYETTACSINSNRACSGIPSGNYKTSATAYAACRGLCGVTERESQACSSTGNRVCTLCSTGTYKNNSVTCSNCAALCSASQKQIAECSASSNRVCQVCDPGYYKSDPTVCSLCTVCAPGYRETVSCTASSNRVCLQCIDDTYRDSDISCASCSLCSPGYKETVNCTATSNRECLECTDETYQDTDFTCAACLQCTAGQEPIVACSSTLNRQCQFCVQGKFKAGVGDAACSNCAAGKYAPTTGLGNCSQCDPGKYQASPGMHDCEDCAAGKYGPTSGLTECNQCEPGKYQASPGMLECELCQVGKYQDLHEQQSCKACPAGKFRGSRGADSIDQCVDCRHDEFSEEGASSCGTCLDQHKSGPGSRTCSLCDAGFFWNSDSFSCVRCHPETYKVEQGPSECKSCTGASVFNNPVTPCTQLTKPCMTGQYYQGIVCMKCSRNHTTLPNPQNVILYSDACVCVAGYERTRENVCMPCLPGYYAPNVHTECQKSPAGMYISTAGSTFAQTCPTNWVSTSAAASYCVPCPWGTHANVKHTVCLPTSSGAAPVAKMHEYQLSFFCVESSTLNRGFLGSATGITKLNTDTWDGNAKAVQLYPDLLKETEHFKYYSECELGFLQSKPLQCDPGSYAMRMHAYIWECVPCPFGTYKTTQGTSRAECLDCSGTHCPQIEQTCGAGGNIYVRNTERNSPHLFKTSHAHV